MHVAAGYELRRELTQDDLNIVAGGDKCGGDYYKRVEKLTPEERHVIVYADRT
jgi:hypothetical protein